MTNWIDRPPDDAPRPGPRIVRTPASTPFTAISLSHDFTGHRTHFANQRTQPCEAPHCPHCAAGLPWRWHGYLAAYIPQTHETVIFEFTPAVSDRLDDYRKTHKTLRGMLFQTLRPSKTQNGRILITCKPPAVLPPDLPPEPDIKRTLIGLWNVSARTANENAARARISPQARHEYSKGDGTE